MIDNETGKATRVDVRPLTIEGILRTNERTLLLLGYFRGALINAAKRLWPEFEPDEPRAELGVSTLLLRPQPELPMKLWRARWRRRAEDGEEFNEEGQGLAEYALILALIAIIAIVALLFVGQQVSGLLNDIGTSI